MDKLKIIGNGKLNGEVFLSGAKNAALPILCSSLLTNEKLVLENVPDLKDINTTYQLLINMGANIIINNDVFEISCAKINNLIAVYDLVKTMRASILILGPTLARFGEVKISLPGGCSIGARPVDQHIKGLKSMGAEIYVKHGYIHAFAKKLQGAHIVMDMITVTGTENILMAATLAQGITIIENAAIEPEVTDLAICLVKMGAKISGIGTSILKIEGVTQLHSTVHKILPDRIEAGTFLCAVAITGGKITLRNVNPAIMQLVLDKLVEAGAIIEVGNDWISMSMNKRPQAVNIKTMPYPGFPTDMQAQFMALNSIAYGSSTIVESIFENRFMHIPELNRMGTNINVQGNTAVINGVNKLYGAYVMATDLRASAGLIIAALAAEGETIIDRIYHLDRGYENIEYKLTKIGAKVIRVT